MLSLKIMIKFVVIVVAFLTPAFSQFTGCDYFQNLTPGQTYDIFSPGYGTNQLYASGTNCRWRAVAPINYQIRINCFDMRLPQNNCNDRLEISWTGIYNDPRPSYACASQTFTYTTGNQIVIALRSQPTGFAGGMFRCQIVAQLSSATGIPLGK